MPEQREMAPVSQQEKDAPGMQAFDPIDCFKQMILARTINDVLKTRKTQGKIDFYIGCAGHEAIAGVIAALHRMTGFPSVTVIWPLRYNARAIPMRLFVLPMREQPIRFFWSRLSLALQQPPFQHHADLPEIGAMAPFAAGVTFVFKRNQSGQVISYHCGDGGVATNDFNVLLPCGDALQSPSDHGRGG